jgi:hypothetical protein
MNSDKVEGSFLAWLHEQDIDPVDLTIIQQWIIRYLMEKK